MGKWLMLGLMGRDLEWQNLRISDKESGKKMHKNTLFYWVSLYCALQILYFLQTEVLWQPCAAR